jgi:2-polyprenyl-3-methyl-5-hydroxy-6-metoxy-1,4-benzoquinol methylase
MICRLCEHDHVDLLIDFGQQPIVHNLLNSSDQDYVKYGFQLGSCRNCGFLQILNPIDPQILYQNYFTVSSWKNQPHVSRLIDILESIVGINEDSYILDIGCNDGSFLESLQQRGYKYLSGIEPTHDASQKALSKGLEVHQGFFGQESASSIYSHKNFDVITTRQVLEHIANLDDFLIGIELLLKDEGVLVIEIPDTEWNLDYLDYALWEEHVNYFTFNTLEQLLCKHNFSVIHYETTLFSGKALIVFCEKMNSQKPYVKHTYHNHDSFKINKYKKCFSLYKKQLTHFLASSQKPIAMYGCGARSSNFINFMEIDSFIDCFIDDQLEKQNFFVPGSNLKIYKWDYQVHNSYTFLLGVNTENEHKVISNRKMMQGNYFSVLPPSRYLPDFWKSMIYDL